MSERVAGSFNGARDAADRVEAFLQALRRGDASVSTEEDRAAGLIAETDRAELRAEDLWALLGALDMPLASAGATGDRLRYNLATAIERTRVQPYAIADAALNIIGRAIGGRR